MCWPRRWRRFWRRLLFLPRFRNMITAAVDQAYWTQPRVWAFSENNLITEIGFRLNMTCCSLNIFHVHSLPIILSSNNKEKFYLWTQFLSDCKLYKDWNKIPHIRTKMKKKRKQIQINRQNEKSVNWYSFLTKQYDKRGGGKTASFMIKVLNLINWPHLQVLWIWHDCFHFFAGKSTETFHNLSTFVIFIDKILPSGDFALSDIYHPGLQWCQDDILSANKDIWPVHFTTIWLGWNRYFRLFIGL